jgi:hypothetical protein
MEVVMRFTFEGVHRWPGAPQASLLGEYHRHMFHVEARKPVRHDERDIEFIAERRSMVAYMNERFACWSDASCETMARTLAEQFKCSQVAVFEDGENGAIFTAADEPSDVPLHIMTCDDTEANTPGETK